MHAKDVPLPAHESCLPVPLTASLPALQHCTEWKNISSCLSGPAGTKAKTKSEAVPIRGFLPRKA